MQSVLQEATDEKSHVSSWKLLSPNRPKLHPRSLHVPDASGDFDRSQVKQAHLKSQLPCIHRRLNVNANIYFHRLLEGGVHAAAANPSTETALSLFTLCPLSSMLPASLLDSWTVRPKSCCCVSPKVAK